jgi:nickel/cobalt transporter (NiCoT) family protein
MTHALSMRARLVALYAILAAFNLGAFACAFFAFHGNPILWGVGFAVYGLGLRHAVDADHIAAIDNVTRKLVQEKQRPVSTGFFFAAGHSTVVFIVVAALAGAARLFGGIQALQSIGSTISTLVSAGFLVTVAAMNISILSGLCHTYRRLSAGGDASADFDPFLDRRGLLARLLRPLFRIVSKSWHMFPLGFLFGLGFDTATEVAMFGASATQASHGAPIGTVLVFPGLFAAGMMLVDTTDGVVMLRAYLWAFVKPLRKIYYNIAITLLSIVVAIAVAGIETLSLVTEGWHLEDGVWHAISRVNDHFNELGLGIVGLFLATWGLSYVIEKAKRPNRADPRVTDPAFTG